MNRWVSTGWQQAMLLCVLAIVCLRCEDQVVAPESGDYLFVAQSISSQQSILEGDPQYIPSVACVERLFPSMTFDAKTKSLKIFGQHFPIDNELQSIIWASGNGAAPWLGRGGCPWAHALPVTHVPVQVDSIVVFVGSEPDGAANLVISGRLVKVEADSDFRTYLRTQRGAGYYRIPPDTTRYRFVIEQVDSLKIHNYGWCPKRLVSFEGSYYGLKQ